MRVKCTNPALAKFRDVEHGIGRTVRREIRKPNGTQIGRVAGEVVNVDEESDEHFDIYTVEVYEPVEFDRVTETQGGEDVVTHRRARVPKDLGKRLVEHPSGMFEAMGEQDNDDEEDS